MSALKACQRYGWQKHSKHPRTRGPLKIGSSTPGRTKGPACKATNMDRYFAKCSRAYRDPLMIKTGAYANWWKNGARKSPPGSIVATSRLYS